MKMKGISAWFEENSRFHIFRLYSEDHALHGTNSKISYIWKRMRCLSNNELGLSCAVSVDGNKNCNNKVKCQR